MNNYTNEIWKDVKDYEGLYAVSNLGRIKRVVGKGCKKERIIKPNLVRGYCQVRLSKDGIVKSLYLHRVILEAFNPIEGMDKLDCNHRDENKENNCLNNLEWLSHKENVNYGTRNERAAAKLKNNPKISEVVRCLDDKRLYPSMKEASRQTGINIASISACCRGKRKSAGGKHWMLEEDYQNMLVAELLEIAFCGEENEPEETDGTDGSELVSICGVPLNDYLAMNEAI